MTLSTGHSTHKTCVPVLRSKRRIFLTYLRITKYNTNLRILKRLLQQSQSNNQMSKILRDKHYLKLLVIKPRNSLNGISKLLLRLILLTITMYLGAIFLSPRPTLYGNKYRHIWIPNSNKLESIMFISQCLFLRKILRKKKVTQKVSRPRLHGSHIMETVSSRNQWLLDQPVKLLCIQHSLNGYKATETCQY